MVVRHSGGRGTYEVKVELAVGLLLVEVNPSNAGIYQHFIERFFNEHLTTLEYLQYVDFLHRREDHHEALEEVKFFDHEELRGLQSSHRIDQQEGKNDDKWVTFKARFKHAMREYFTDYNYSHTPVE